MGMFSIHWNQVEFILGMQSQLNFFVKVICQVLIIQNENLNKKSHMVIPNDSEKAMTKIYHPFMKNSCE